MHKKLLEESTNCNLNQGKDNIIPVVNMHVQTRKRKELQSGLTVSRLSSQRGNQVATNGPSLSQSLGNSRYLEIINARIQCNFYWHLSPLIKLNFQKS